MRYRLTIEVPPRDGDAEGVRRLRSLLKRLLRSYGVRCLDVEPAPAALAVDAGEPKAVNTGTAGDDHRQPQRANCQRTPGE